MITNKAQSDYEIKKRNLNRVTEEIFTNQSSIDEIKKFLENNKCEFYNIRDKSKASGEFKYKLTAEEVLKEVKNYEKFSIYESLAAADEKLVVQGEIEIKKDFTVAASLSDVKGISNRTAMQSPVYRLNFNLLEEREPVIRGLKKVVDYVIKKQLFGMIVEFSLFEIPVGVNKENLIIWELRNY